MLENILSKLCVPYNIAKDLMDIGFNEPCIDYFINGVEQNTLTINYNSDNNIRDFESVARPTYEQAFNYFLDKYDIDSCIHIDNSYEIYGGIHTKGYKNLNHIESIRFETKEMCKIECLKNLIELIKNK